MSRHSICDKRGLSKTYRGGKQVLQDIHLSLSPDAKIGVLGVNGAGKSTLLRSWQASTRNRPARPVSLDGGRIHLGYPRRSSVHALR
ncbi:ATPase subunit of ABC transporter with duplicated ATPase domains [Bosea sp. BE125]|nr:ATPase subunit of ABC transporter with duplicated ATPase domains [Bosea sp. BE125]